MEFAVGAVQIVVVVVVYGRLSNSERRFHEEDGGGAMRPNKFEQCDISMVRLLSLVSPTLTVLVLCGAVSSCWRTPSQVATTGEYVSELYHHRILFSNILHFVHV